MNADDMLEHEQDLEERTREIVRGELEGHIVSMHSRLTVMTFSLEQGAKSDENGLEPYQVNGLEAELLEVKHLLDKSLLYISHNREYLEKRP